MLKSFYHECQYFHIDYLQRKSNFFCIHYTNATFRYRKHHQIHFTTANSLVTPSHIVVRLLLYSVSAVAIALHPHESQQSPKVTTFTRLPSFRSNIKRHTKSHTSASHIYYIWLVCRVSIVARKNGAKGNLCRFSCPTSEPNRHIQHFAIETRRVFHCAFIDFALTRTQCSCTLFGMYSSFFFLRDLVPQMCMFCVSQRCYQLSPFETKPEARVWEHCIGCASSLAQSKSVMQT